MRDANPLQGTGAWFNERTGKLTASRMASAMAFLKNGNEATERKKLKREILAERMTDQIVPKYVTKEMQWGIDMEPQAKEAFETTTGLIITDLGWVPHPRIEMFGCSPDGKTSDGCLIEVKCPSTLTFVEWLLAGEIPEEHRIQMTVQSACLGGIPVYFCAYDPRVKDPLPKLIIKKFEPTPNDIKEVEDQAQRFLDEIDTLFDLITKGD